MVSCHLRDIIVSHARNRDPPSVVHFVAVAGRRSGWHAVRAGLLHLVLILFARVLRRGWSTSLLLLGVVADDGCDNDHQEQNDDDEHDGRNEPRVPILVVAVRARDFCVGVRAGGAGTAKVVHRRSGHDRTVVGCVEIVVVAIAVVTTATRITVFAVAIGTTLHTNAVFGTHHTGAVGGASLAKA